MLKNNILKNQIDRLKYLEKIHSKNIDISKKSEIMPDTIINSCNNDAERFRDYRLGILSSQINSSLKSNKINCLNFRYCYPVDKNDTFYNSPRIFGKTFLLNNIGVFKDEKACINLLCFNNKIYGGVHLNYKMPTVKNCKILRGNTALSTIENKLKKLGFDISMQKSNPINRLGKYIQFSNKIKDSVFVDIVQGTEKEIIEEIADRLSKSYKQVEIRQFSDLYTVAGKGKKKVQV